MFMDSNLLENLPFKMEAAYCIIDSVKVSFSDDRLSCNVTELEEGHNSMDHHIWDQAEYILGYSPSSMPSNRPQSTA
ncbi:hypothetical protein M404DRAFT_31638 [Pisolithus tinctorius Marx 270]|uniref:Uncharacterized protein n=1 Tax=Pisolithus tinctorius Marx 270 TaxID=870435 RepID=A0A0C3JKG8_PISTI|nr:hypothetical protein M404DRAFT_31638 [Pisolithus tinctorius Marx 270]